MGIDSLYGSGSSAKSVASQYTLNSIKVTSSDDDLLSIGGIMPAGSGEEISLGKYISLYSPDETKEGNVTLTFEVELQSKVNGQIYKGTYSPTIEVAKHHYIAYPDYIDITTYIDPSNLIYDWGDTVAATITDGKAVSYNDKLIKEVKFLNGDNKFKISPQENIPSGIQTLITVELTLKYKEDDVDVTRSYNFMCLYETK